MTAAAKSVFFIMMKSSGNPPQSFIDITRWFGQHHPSRHSNNLRRAAVGGLCHGRGFHPRAVVTIEAGPAPHGR